MYLRCLRCCVLPAAAETAQDKNFSGPLTCHAVVAVKTWKNLPIIDNALHVEDVDVDPGYLQTMFSLINHTAYKSFLEMTGLVLTHLKGTLALSRLWVL